MHSDQRYIHVGDMVYAQSHVRFWVSLHVCLAYHSSSYTRVAKLTSATPVNSRAPVNTKLREATKLGVWTVDWTLELELDPNLDSFSTRN